MLTSQRKSLLLDMLRREGQVIAKRAAEEFSLSEDTIRRDLREMAAEGLLRRVHGGAMPISPDLPDLSARRAVSSGVKQRLGRAAADMVKPGQTIFLDGGTSTAEIARALPRDFAFTIVTHSPTIAAELEHHPTAEVTLIGGRLYKHSMVATGAAAMAQIALMRPDIFFLGVTALHPARGLSTGDFEEAAIKRHIAACSAETITLVTEEKLDAVSPHVIMPVSALSGMIVQEGIEEERIAPYRAIGVGLMEA
ncbi:DeoR/GlpR family DNA-binding transcription regulator [Neorhizobium galegae]|uniref:DeoR/GlpR family DNA-binding transcription regulator n=1 Tax=Neorhizobium galegae TaxID=399 RepID=UPI000622AFC2|nr:DeoR/GlpR family DNA-binding transcription regulator [Neorhizobium galegae]CDZ29505.1 Transcriptional regulator, DeoR family [Neorhizobium galegae bv. officinalis]KAA9386258.1 DeoR/GlpR transcriptional regulator [Neorhizobium galegae]KAB1113298.1 DeoR/GlpR transcriptional regulator [Neorhizobium galegae]MCM2496244.1 DeoR/GlpR family DNA-binding transcription regulator [Neorhizobium galegae]MCQ1770620.1 DeoR/GlpR family DNA-binding transcription regulator [Neorhizobium galegae]